LGIDYLFYFFAATDNNTVIFRSKFIKKKYLVWLMLVTIAIGYTGHVLASCACLGHSFALYCIALALCFVYNWCIGINIFGVTDFAWL
jgi:hypothetical protein